MEDILAAEREGSRQFLCLLPQGRTEPRRGGPDLQPGLHGLREVPGPADDLHGLPQRFFTLLSRPGGKQDACLALQDKGPADLRALPQGVTSPGRASASRSPPSIEPPQVPPGRWKARGVEGDQARAREPVPCGGHHDLLSTLPKKCPSPQDSIFLFFSFLLHSPRTAVLPSRSIVVVVGGVTRRRAGQRVEFTMSSQVATLFRAYMRAARKFPDANVKE